MTLHFDVVDVAQAILRPLQTEAVRLERQVLRFVTRPVCHGRNEPALPELVGDPLLSRRARLALDGARNVDHDRTPFETLKQRAS